MNCTGLAGKKDILAWRLLCVASAVKWILPTQYLWDEGLHLSVQQNPQHELLANKHGHLKHHSRVIRHSYTPTWATSWWTVVGKDTDRRLNICLQGTHRNHHLLQGIGRKDCWHAFVRGQIRFVFGNPVEMTPRTKQQLIVF